MNDGLQCESNKYKIVSRDELTDELYSLINVLKKQKTVIKAPPV